MGDFEYLLIMPVVCLAAYGLLTLVMAPALRGSARWLGLVSVIGFVMTGTFLFRLWQVWVASGPQETAFGMVRVDGLSLFFSFIVLLVGALSVLYSISFLEREEADHGEFYPLILFGLAGAMMMLNTTHLMMMLVGLEVFSLALYVLTGLTRMRIRSIEASLKYFLLGAFASGFIVYGMALLYGAAGSLDLVRISAVAASDPGRLLWLGLGLVFIGLAFKIAIVPFHQWVPDVYTGAPTNVTGFMAAATKTVAFAVLLRLMVGAFGEHRDVWVPLVTWLAILTMTVANLVALAQTNVKRLLAFSSIAHAGYLLIGLVSGPEDGVRAISFYLTTYALMTVGAFAVVASVGRGDAEREQGYEFADWAGLARNRPVLALAMTFFLFSLAGLPPTGGFFGKYVVFQAAIQAEHYMLAVVGMLNATIAAYYYLRLIIVMYMREPESHELPPAITAATATVMLLSVAGTLYLGLAPSGVLDLLAGLARPLI